MTMVAERTLDRRTAREIGSVQAQVDRHEHRESWGRVIHLGRVIHTATVAERPDVVLHVAGELVSLGQRRLRQLGDDVA